jgi:hypothetical protein
MPFRYAAVFAPEGRLPRATLFNVEVPQGTRAETGETLTEPYKFTFSTALPDLVHVEPGDHDESLKPDTVFALRFNQPVDDAAIRRNRAWPGDLVAPHRTHGRSHLAEK